jgi:tetratricopeptide (TPR) repeat protein
MKGQCDAIEIGTSMKQIENLDLSDYSRPYVTNCDGIARQYFDQGLRLLLSYQHEWAAKCFLECIHLSPDCALASALLAFSHGPNYNFRGAAYYELSSPVEEIINEDDYLSHPFPSQIVADKYSQNAIEKVQELRQTNPERSKTFTEVEKALIYAFRILGSNPGMSFLEAEEKKDKAFAYFMRKLYHKHVEDPEVAYFYISSMMTIHAWNLFEYPIGKPLSSDVPEILEALENSLRIFPNHVGLCHMYVHICEMSSFPQRALGACQVLRSTFRDAGHLVHMPSHIDVLIGDYEACVKVNIAAIYADKKAMIFSPDTAGITSFYFGYMVHNYHMLVYGSILGGFEKIAMDYSMELNNYVNERLFTERPDLAVYLESYGAMDVHMLVRFGRWKEILKLKFPRNKELMLYRSASLYFARALAYANLNNTQAAREEAKYYEILRAHPEAKNRVLHNNTIYDLLEVDSPMIKGEIAYFERDFETAFESLRQAVCLQDALNYDEPWGKMQPIRHALGGLLFEQCHVEEAEKVFREDLKRHPKNPWALNGLIRCLESYSHQDNANCCFSLSMERRKLVKRVALSRKKTEIESLQEELSKQRKCQMADFKIGRPCACCKE